MTARHLLGTVLVFLLSLLSTGNACAVYDVQLGRFLQPDPYAAGQPVLDDMSWFHGRSTISAAPMPIDLAAHYQNGVNHYEYVASNPVNYSDPLGLYVVRGLRPGQLLGPGWNGGVVMWDPVDIRRLQARHMLRGLARDAIAGAGTKAVIGLGQAIGAGLAHALYGDRGRDANDVLWATVYQIGMRTGQNMLMSGVPRGVGDLAEAGFGAFGGGNDQVVTWLGVGASVGEAAAGLRGVNVVGSAAFRFASPVLLGASVYSGVQEYIANDGLNWGFGVDGRDLYDFWD